MATTKLTDAQRVILAAAAARESGLVLPLPKSLGDNRGTLGIILKSLMSRGLVTERAILPDEELWRDTAELGRTTLVISTEGLKAIGIDPTEHAVHETDDTLLVDETHETAVTGGLGDSAELTKCDLADAGFPKQGTKLGSLAAALRRADGATIAELMEATGWQAHSVRGAMSGNLKKKLSLEVSRHSQLSRLMHLLADDLGKEGIVEQLKLLDAELKKAKPLTDTQKAISTRHSAMLGDQLAQALSIELGGTDFTKMAARLSLLVNTFEIERNGLGYNNLIFMAVVLNELAKNADAAFRSLIVEEPEAHLHPQLQAVLLQYLSGILHEAGEKPVQVFVTSHSPNFASIAKLDSVVCLVEADNGVQVFHPRSVKFEKGQREKLERYLDVTRAELFFARRAIFVEGAAELMMVSTLARVLTRKASRSSSQICVRPSPHLH